MMTHGDERATDLRHLTALAERLSPEEVRELLHLARSPEELQALSDIAGQLSRDELRDLHRWVRLTTGANGGID
jgi:hypothetical protein